MYMPNNDSAYYVPRIVLHIQHRGTHLILKTTLWSPVVIPTSYMSNQVTQPGFGPGGQPP